MFVVSFPNSLFHVDVFLAIDWPNRAQICGHCLQLYTKGSATIRLEP